MPRPAKADPPAAAPAGVRQAAGSSAGLRHAYVFLAVVATAAVLAGVLLTWRITRIHALSIHESQVWTERVNRYVALRGMASAISSPVSEGAESKDAAGESAKFAQATAEFDQRMVGLRANLEADGDSDALAVLAALDGITASMAEMRAHGAQTLERLGQGLPPTLTGTPAAIDRDLKEVNAAITRVTTMVRALQIASGAQAEAAAGVLDRAQFVVAGTTLPLVVVLMLIGWRVSRRLSLMFQELCDARAAAEQASRSKSEFLANMSHEIRTPMTAILGFADVLLEGVRATHASPEQIEAAQTIERNGAYLLSVINDILDLSKIEAGKLTVERIPCSPCGLVAEVESLMRVRSDSRGLRFELRYDGPMPETIQTDPTRVRQMLINVVGNAIKFTEVGGVQLIIRLVDAGAGGSNLEFDVVDTGIGMSEEQAARLFQPFTQADASTTRSFGGTGLGLTICKRLAEELGGDVRIVETAPGKGTRFRLTIPAGPLDGVTMIADPIAATVIAHEPAEPVKRPASDHLDCRVLLAEDGQDNQRLIAHLLQKAGAEVVVVENGKLAVEAALAGRDAGHPFSVILMDMQMPVMDGYRATALLREKGYTGSIIALTAHAMATDQQKCLDAGCDDYASKPIQRDRLIEAIQSHLRPGGMAVETPETVSAPLVSELAGNPDVADLVRTFVAELPARVQCLERACAAEDLQHLTRLAHQLKGSAGGHGFPALAEAAAKLEQEANGTASLAKLSQAVNQIAELCSRARAGTGTRLSAEAGASKSR